MAAVTTPRQPLYVIERSTGFGGLGLGELWRQRELLFTFTKRNVLVRYKQTALGIGWAILQPLFLMVVFTLFFQKLGSASSGGIPYPIFSYAGLLPWTFFATSLTQSALSLVANQNLLRKIYFPRLILPLSTVLTALVDFAVASSVLFVMMVAYGVYPEPVRLLALPGLIVLALATALGVGLWLSALNVAYRDVQYVVPFLAQAWLFATPAVYVSTTFSEPWASLLGLNPMQGVVSGFRWALLDEGSAPGPVLAVSACVTAVLLASGVVVFRRLERTFADIV
jgi:homopolymeric O-antigen transport system permease protein